MNFVKFFILSIGLLNAAAGPALSEPPVSRPSVSAFTNFLAGQYYQNASVIGYGTSAFEVHKYLSDRFNSNPDFQRGEIETDALKVIYYFRTSGTHTDVVLLPFLHKATGYIFEQTFDKSAKDVFEANTLVRDHSIRFITDLQEQLKGRIVCHMLTHESPEGFKLAQLTRLGKIAKKIVFDDKNPGHLNYMSVTLDNTGITQATFYEPNSPKVASCFVKKLQELKQARYEGLKFPISYVYRGDQCLNMRDCGRFSLIYLLYAVQGRDVKTLTNFDVYQGFRRWIEGGDGAVPGFLTYQKQGSKKDAGKDFDKMLLEISAQVEKIKLELPSNEQLVGFDAVSNGYLDKIKEFQETIRKFRDELALKHSDSTQAHITFYEGMITSYYGFLRSAHASKIAKIQRITQETQDEASAPQLQKSWFVTFTTPYRWMIHQTIENTGRVMAAATIVLATAVGLYLKYVKGWWS